MSVNFKVSKVLVTQFSSAVSKVTWNSCRKTVPQSAPRPASSSTKARLLSRHMRVGAGRRPGEAPRSPTHISRVNKTDAVVYTFDDYDEEKTTSYRLHMLTFAACLSMIQFGYATGIIAGALLYLETGTILGTLTTMDKSFLVSSITFGAVIGTILCGYISAKYGRRWTLLSNNVLYMVGAVGAACAQSLPVLIAFRFISGVGVGVSTALTTMYIVECVPTNKRGQLGGFAPLCGTLGILLSYFASLLLGQLQGNWRWMMLAGALPSLLQLALSRHMPESPRWLATEGRKVEALMVLQNIGNKDAALPTAAEGDAAGGWTTLLKPRLRKPVLIGATLNAFQQMCGINVVVYFAPKILTQIGFGKELSIILTAIIGVMQLLSTFMLTKVVDTYGRRPLAFAGITGMILGLCALMASFWPSLQGITWLPMLAVVGILLYRVSFSYSMGPIPYIITAEVFPTSARSLGVAFSSATQWMMNFMVSITFLPIVGILGSDGVWLIYIFTCLMAAGFIAQVVPEMKGREMEDTSD